MDQVGEHLLGVRLVSRGTRAQSEQNVGKEVRRSSAALDWHRYL